MAKATTTTPKSVKATKVATTSKPEKVTLSAVAQRKVKALRASRDAEKLAKDEASLARDFIIEFVKEELQEKGFDLTDDIVGTDKQGKRLVSVKVMPSAEKIDWGKLQKDDPEAYNSVRALLSNYITPKGAGKPTIRVDVI